MDVTPKVVIVDYFEERMNRVLLVGPAMKQAAGTGQAAISSSQR